MKERKIKMTPAEAKDFVNEASKCDFDIDISYNHYIVDAKSILGVMGLDFKSTLTLQYQSRLIFDCLCFLHAV